MTTFDTAAAWHKIKPITLALCVSSLAFGLAGCETASSLFSSMSDAPTAAVASAPATAPTTRPAQVAIAPVIGPPDTVSKQLQAQLAGDLEKQNIRVAKSAGESAQYTLRGYVVSSIDKKGSRAKISYIWDVTDAAGKGVHRVSGEELAPSGNSHDPWTAVTGPVVEAITSKTVDVAHGLAAEPVGSAGRCERRRLRCLHRPRALTTGSSTPTAGTAPPAAPRATGSIGTGGAIKARVPIVNGAPGDGSSSLRMALQRELSRNGVALSETTAPDTYTVEGKVAMGASADGKQPITIDWSVSDPNGKKLGSVSQKNEVPQGSLDGPWGKTADAAAAAAAQGILKLLPQATTQTTSAN